MRAVPGGTSHAPEGHEGHVDGEGGPMKASAARPSVLAVLVLLCRVEPAACLAQPPASPTPTATPAARASGMDSLPSTVSPAIERFLKEGGRDLPSTGPLGSPAPTPVRRPVPPFVLPAAVPPTIF